MMRTQSKSRTRQVSNSANIAKIACGFIAMVCLSCVVRNSNDDALNESNSGSASQTLITNPLLTSNIGAGTVEAPKADAVVIAPHTPLRNGQEVTKKRWLWLPPGTQITLASDNVLNVPINATLWKEFYFNVNGRAVLIERRLIRKIANSGALSDWEFKTSRKRIQGENNIIGDVITDVASLAPFELKANEATPTNPFEWDAHIRVQNDVKYVFPGQKMCTTCHSGAAAAYPSAKTTIGAFSLQPASLTEQSRDALVAKGYISQEDVNKLLGFAPKFSEMNVTRKLLAEFRTNCMSCHSPTSKAHGNLTNFRLDPKKDYSNAELVSALRAQSVEKSTLLESIPQHLTGALSIMPPVSGGIPKKLGAGLANDPERTALLKAFNDWRNQSGAN